MASVSMWLHSRTRQPMTNRLALLAHSSVCQKINCVSSVQLRRSICALKWWTPDHKAHRMVLIFILPFCRFKTSWIRGWLVVWCASLHPNFCCFSLHLAIKGWHWPGSVELKNLCLLIFWSFISHCCLQNYLFTGRSTGKQQSKCWQNQKILVHIVRIIMKLCYVC